MRKSLVIIVVSCLAQSPMIGQQPGAADTAALMGLAELIAKVKENEELVRNLTATFKISAPGSEHNCRMVTDGKRLMFSDEQIIFRASGEKLSAKQAAWCDGERTLVVDEGRCAMLFYGRYEPGRMLPPHTWGMFTHEMSFPLSMYLQGTAALKSHPKARLFPLRNLLSEGDNAKAEEVETQLVGEELVDELTCVKVRVRRWGYNTDAPLIHYLWLAKDRNYHVAQSQKASVQNGAEVPDRTTRVTQWRMTPAGIWLPAVVTEQRNQLQWQFNLDQVILNLKKYPEDLFAFPEVPDSLPTFTLTNDGHVEKSPRHPEPIPGEVTATLDSILERLVAEETRYSHLEIKTVHNYEVLARSGPYFGQGDLSSETRERTIFAGAKVLYSNQKTWVDAKGQSSTSAERELFDGRWLRQSHVSSEGAGRASLWLSPGNMRLVRPHTTCFRHGFDHRPLSQILKSGRLGRTKLVVEYVGDERIDDLLCHKLKCELPQDGSTFCIWLARDRNLIPIRREWHRAGWSEKFPETLDYVEELREFQAGMWFPYRTTLLWFQFSPCDMRPLPVWRQDIRVESLTANPPLDDKFFGELEVPEGGKFHVLAENGDYLGRLSRPPTGNIDVRPEELRAMRQIAPVDADQAARSRKALEGTVGQPAPDLPPGVWLNSAPLSWKDLRGKTVIVQFWAHWAANCDAELKTLQERHEFLNRTGKADQAIIAIHTAGSERNVVSQAAAEQALTFPIMLDSAGGGSFAWGELFDKFAVRQLPVTFVIDATGKIVAQGTVADMLAIASQLAKQ